VKDRNSLTGRPVRVGMFVAFSTLLLGCDNNQAEQRLMSDVSSAGPVLERRIAEWVSVQNGLIVLTENQGQNDFSIWAIPASTPWIVSCTDYGIELGFGFWLVESDSSITREPKRYLTKARLSEQQCKGLVPVVGQALLALTNAQGVPMR
jgi:hypothetical protein